LLAYRAGWDLGKASIVSNVSAAILLVPLGVLLFCERPTLLNLTSVMICIVGLILINYKH
jgi:drug/metabolite transporter (DMT)-like permease